MIRWPRFFSVLDHSVIVIANEPRLKDIERESKKLEVRAGWGLCEGGSQVGFCEGGSRSRIE